MCWKRRIGGGEGGEGGDHQVSQQAGRVIMSRSCHHLPLLSAGLEQLINIAPIARNTLDININYTQSSLLCHWEHWDRCAI